MSQSPRVVALRGFARTSAITIAVAVAMGVVILATACGAEPVPAECQTNTDCDDGNSCTTDTCNADARCVNNALVCDDGLFCNGQETCDPDVGCQVGDAPVIDDEIPCTNDRCDEDSDIVVNEPDHGSCDDGLFCNGQERCDADADCQPGTLPVIDDQVSCTDDWCDEDGDTVVHAPDDGLCDDGLFCNGSETCDPVADCLAGAAPGDGVACTDDICDEASDSVISVANDANCDDNDDCTTTDFCDPLLDCQNIADADPVCGTCDNCGFEAGDLSGWVSQDIAMPLDPLRAEVLGGAGAIFWTVAPTEGSYAAYHGFDGAGPGTIELGQDISIHPSVSSATLAFDFRAGWDMTFGATLPRTFEVLVEPAGGGMALQSDVIMTAAPGTTIPDTDYEAGAVDLTPFIGQTVFIRFVWDIPENSTGPAAFQLDNIAVTTP